MFSIGYGGYMDKKYKNYDIELNGYKLYSLENRIIHRIKPLFDFPVSMKINYHFENKNFYYVFDLYKKRELITTLEEPIQTLVQQIALDEYTNDSYLILFDKKSLNFQGLRIPFGWIKNYISQIKSIQLISSKNGFIPDQEKCPGVLTLYNTLNINMGLPIHYNDEHIYVILDRLNDYKELYSELIRAILNKLYNLYSDKYFFLDYQLDGVEKVEGFKNLYKLNVSDTELDEIKNTHNSVQNYIYSLVF